MTSSEPASKNVLVVCQHYWPESFRVTDICEFLVERGCRVDVLCGIPNYPTGKFFAGYSYFRRRQETHEGVRIRRAFEVPRGNNTNPRVFLNYISFPLASLFHLPRLLTKRYDKIFVFTYSPVMMSTVGILVGRIRRTEITMSVLDLWPENLFAVLDVRSRPLRWLATVVSHWYYRQVDKMIVPSEAMRARMHEIAAISDDDIVTLPQVCEKIYERDIHDEQLATRFEGGFNVVFTGNISPAQSFGTVIAAATQLRDEGIGGIRWIIVGDGMSRGWLEQEVADAGLTESFHFEGQKPVSDIPRYTGVADALLGCLVKSDLLEASIPAKVTSYLAAGKPLVLAMDGEVRELVNDLARCGYAGPTEDAQALAENIKRLYHLPEAERQAMGERGRAYHFEHFERNLVLNRLHDFLFA